MEGALDNLSSILTWYDDKNTAKKSMAPVLKPTQTRIVHSQTEVLCCSKENSKDEEEPMVNSVSRILTMDDDKMVIYEDDSTSGNESHYSFEEVEDASKTFDFVIKDNPGDSKEKVITLNHLELLEINSWSFLIQIFRVFHRISFF